MNVLFDVSPLGIAHFSSYLRTGIFRVVENIALGLYTAENCHTTFCASHCNYDDCRNYFDSYPVFNGYKMSQPDDLLTSIYNYIEPFRLRVSKLKPKGWKAPLRKIYHLGKKFTEPIDVKDLKSANIFHSPFLPIPRQIIQEKTITKFITIHDLTPFIYPQYCSPLTVDLLKIIHSSIKPDTFVICISKATRQDFLAYMPSLDPAMVSVIYLAAGSHFYCCKDLNRIQQIRLKYGIPSGSPYFLALSTLQPHKNFERTISSFINLVKQEHIKDLHLVIAGPAGLSCEKIYKETEKSGKLAGRIILTGYIADEDLAPLYSGALAFLFPSLYEGFGLPSLEAMQCGTPVITSNNSSLPEVVGDAAITIDPKDGDALSQAMLDIYENEDLQKKLSELSLERAKMFNWEKTTVECIAAYKRALS
ncbi:MAG: glycosyltransferase family 1 protein [Deltaproteobacteria bacterium]|nr:glycosyltransferase family 1 protein [Deltaproteobacteria bacterium]